MQALQCVGRMNSRLACVLSWMCLVGLGLPRVGVAAEDAPRLEAPRLALSGPLAGPGSPDEARSSREPERPRATRGLRLLTEVGRGLLTAAGAGLSLGLLGYGLCEVTQLGYESSVGGCIGTASLGAVLGVVLGYPLGVWWGGELQGGDGPLLSAMLGAAVGLLAGSAVTAVIFGSGNPSLYELPWVAVPVLFAMGAHLGYELFQRAPVQPLVSFSSRGALLGLGGRF